MYYAWKAAQTEARESPSQVLQAAYDGTMKEQEVRAGASRLTSPWSPLTESSPHSLHFSRLSNSMCTVARSDEWSLEIGQVRSPAPVRFLLAIFDSDKPSLGFPPTVWVTLASQ